MRLNKYISNSGYTSRRKADDLIFQGKVMVGDKIIKDPAYRVNKTDIIKVNNVEIHLEEKIYYLLNKPVGYMSSLADPNYDKFVVDLIPTDKRIYPVGRLDIDSSGLLILTNDGELTNKLTHPSNRIEKKYYLRLEKPLSKNDVEMLENGVKIDNKMPAKGLVEYISNNEYYISISEGRNRQIRKMIDAVGNSVIDLCRVKIGSLNLGNLKAGSYRKLTEEEVIRLKEL